MTAPLRFARAAIAALCLALLLSGAAGPVDAQISGFQEHELGDHFYFHPSGPPRQVLVVAHGWRPEDTPSVTVARRMRNGWRGFAEANDLVLIVPVFDDARFGNRGTAHAGYRALYGRHAGADAFVIALVRLHQQAFGLPERPFLLYGHSAGGQFANRFAVRRPAWVDFVVVTAPGRYTFPAPSVPWPFGASEGERELTWPDGFRQTVRVGADLADYAAVAGRIHVIVGAADTEPQGRQPAHPWPTRLERAIRWVDAMNLNARAYGNPRPVTLQIVPGAGHARVPLQPRVEAALRQHLSAGSGFRGTQGN
jgi:pimeloyl-ACP methyl ester carboxylesterase